MHAGEACNKRMCRMMEGLLQCSDVFVPEHTVWSVREGKAAKSRQGPELQYADVVAVSS